MAVIHMCFVFLFFAWKTAVRGGAGDPITEQIVIPDWTPLTESNYGDRGKQNRLSRFIVNSAIELAIKSEYNRMRSFPR